MSIVIYEDSNKIKIVVEKLHRKEDISKLLSILKKETLFEISFLNIQFLPKEIILQLAKIKDRVFIFTNEITLKNYLVDLGFTLQFKDHYEDKNQNLSLEYLTLGGSAGSLKKWALRVS